MQEDRLKVSKDKARAVFLTALQLATSNEAVPDEWTKRTTRIDATRNRTYTPVLGTALLAKATNPEVSALALKSGGVHRGYSPRSLAKGVFVPLCVESRIDIRTHGAEPFNNQPFFAKNSIHKDLVPPHSPDRPDLEYLVECLQRADYLQAEEATLALAAFIRARRALGRGGAALDLGATGVGLLHLGNAAGGFIALNPEGGRRGQAFVAACLDLAYPGRVIGGAINDPSVHVPGDIAVLADPLGSPANSSGDSQPAAPAATVILAAEAKQRPVLPSEIWQFSQRLAAKGIGKAVYAALAPAQPHINATKMSLSVVEEHGIGLDIYTSSIDLLRSAVLWAPASLQECLGRFPNLLAQRLSDFHCDASSQQEWHMALATPCLRDGGCCAPLRQRPAPSAVNHT
ncbi:restriction endonuclease, SacI family [Actinoplanes sp. CA-131856]